MIECFIYRSQMKNHDLQFKMCIELDIIQQILDA